MSCIWSFSCANNGDCSGCLRDKGTDKYEPKNGVRCPICAGLMENEQLICKDCQYDYVLAVVKRDRGTD